MVAQLKVDSSKMTSKVVSDYIICLGIAYFLANFNEAAPVVTHVGNGGENFSILCETVCSGPEWKVIFDKEKFACLCTVANSTDGTEYIFNNLINVDSKNLMPMETKTSYKRDTTEILKKNVNTSLSNGQDKKAELQSSDKSKTKKVKPSKACTKDNVLNKQTTVLTAKESDIHKDTTIENIAKHVKNIDANPSKIHDEMENKITNENTMDVKRIPKDNSKQLSEIESNPASTTIKDSFGIGHFKPLKALKKSSDTIIGGPSPKNKLLKSITTKKAANSNCRSLSITNQLQTIKERISNLIEETKQPNFNCALLNKEVEAIKAALQIINKGPETKQRELDREKFLEQIREKEKERHARIQSRLGNLDLTKHKINIVGRIRTTEKTPPADETPKLGDISSKVVTDSETR